MIPIAKYDNEGRCIKAGRSTKKLKEKFEKFGEAVLMAFMAVGTAVLLAQFFGVMIGAIDPRP
ncbi:hypothetical protein [Mitsuokella jalaludinii]|jgi:hypothetical protein|uniref:hypothetical protein n=1 Tax=Mitsuokella jalaludinii TaxID=187979 RepID=UPI00307ACEF3